VEPVSVVQLGEVDEPVVPPVQGQRLGLVPVVRQGEVPEPVELPEQEQPEQIPAAQQGAVDEPAVLPAQEQQPEQLRAAQQGAVDGAATQEFRAALEHKFFWEGELVVLPEQELVETLDFQMG
jgi:hypothetical protein